MRSENVVSALLEARVEIDRLRSTIDSLQRSVDTLARERNEAVQAVNTLRDEPSGEVWVKQESSTCGCDDHDWVPPVTIGPRGKSMYSNAATLDRALGWFWKNTFEAFAGRSDYELPACRLINIRTGHTIPLTLRAMATPDSARGEGR